MDGWIIWGFERASCGEDGIFTEALYKLFQAVALRVAETRGNKEIRNR